jgi:hypothetical protein
MANRVGSLHPAHKRTTPISAQDIDSVAVGDKVHRYFKADELGRNQLPQWINGRVTGYRMQSNRGPKKHLKWWTVSFDPPAVKGILCDTQEVVLMKEAAATQRERKDKLEKLVGTEILVEWTPEDRDLSLSDCTLPLRICKVVNFMKATHQFFIRFKCAYEKILEEAELIELVQASSELRARAKKRTNMQKQIREAECEWATGTIPFTSRTGDNHDKVEEGRRLELEGLLKQQAVLADAMLQKEQAIAEQVQRRTEEYNARIVAQRDAILRLQMEQAAAARDTQDEARSRATGGNDNENGAEVRIQQCTHSILASLTLT